MIQAIIFDNKIWTEKTAKKWLKEHGYVPIKPVHKTLNFLRYRLLDPSLFNRFIMRKLPNNIELVIGL